MDHGVWPVRGKPGEVAFLLRHAACEPGRTVEHAFDRCGFSPEEWRLLEDAPLRAFLWVATVDGPVHAREREACRKVLAAGLYARSPLVGRLCEGALRRLDGWGPECPGEPMDLEPLRPLGARVARRLGLGEAARFHGCLLEVGARVARASHGVWGLLGRVRARERLALETLAETLGVPLRPGPRW